MSPESEPQSEGADLTALLQAASTGNVDAEEKIADIVYTHLKKIAQKRMAAERPGHTLSATALVNEAWLKLGKDLPRGDWKSRTHFYGAAASAMRRALVDHARGKRAEKRGGGRTPVDFTEALNLATHHDPADVLALADAIGQLASEEPRVAQVVRFKFYAGLGVDEIAAALSVSRRTVLNDWSFARAWLYRELGGVDKD